jgi:PAS domain S-box-containing protein
LVRLLLSTQEMDGSRPHRLGMRWYLTLLLAAVLLPPAIVSALGPHLGAASVLAWSTSLLVSIVLGVMTVRVLERRLAGPGAALTRAARAVSRGEVPHIDPLPVTELDEAARALEAAAAARQDVERRLRVRAERLAALVDAAAAPLIVVDRARNVVLFNRAAETLFGYPASDVLGTPADRFVSGSLLRAVSAQLEARLPPAAAPREPADFSGVRRGGEEFPVEAALAIVDFAGERLCAILLRDVTDHARQEAEGRRRLDDERTARAEAEDAARRAELLAESGRMLTASLDPDVVLTGIARLVIGVLADWCVMDRVDEDGEVRRVAVAHADASRDEAARVLREHFPAALDDPDVVWPTLSRGELVVVTDVSERDLERRARSAEHLRVLRALGVRSYVVVPFVARGRTLGAMTLVRAAGGPYAGADVEAARDLADRVAIALDNAELFRHAQAAHARFAGLVDGLGAIVWEADPATLSFRFVSQRAETLLGYPLPRWTDERQFLKTLVHPDDRDRTLDAFRACAATGDDCHIEHRAVAADGRVLWFDSIVRAERDANGDVGRLQGLMIDVTERRRLQAEREQLLASEQAARAEAEAAARRARLVAEASEVLSASLEYEATLRAVARLAVPSFADWCLAHVTDEAGTRVYAASADPAAAAITEALERVVPALKAGEINPLLGLFTSGEGIVSEVAPAWLEALRLVQRLAPTSMITVPMTARGRPIGSLVFLTARSGHRYGPADLAVARDLAQRAAVAVDNARLFREAERANRTKDEFVATLSHELRTPLGAMLGWVQMLRSRRLTGDEAERALESIERNTRLQARLIHDLLDVSRIVAGKLTLERRLIDLVPVLEHAVETVRRDARAKGLTVDWTVEAGEHRVLGDAMRLEQVALNLLSNAVKFTPRGGRITTRLDRSAGYARLSVADTGEGIEPAALPYVFEIFRQADSTTTRRHGGLGLGLAIVRHIVDLHGGRVEASSPGRGAGATFTVLLPLTLDAPAEHALAPPPQPATREAPPRLDGVRVLAVDDDEESRRLVKAVLDDCGADVSIASSVDEALDKLGTTFVDVLVSDIGMPGADGYDLIRRLREAEQAHGGHIPAIALTAYAGDDDRARALAAGFSDYVTKPVGPDELAGVVARVVGRTAVG